MRTKKNLIRHEFIGLEIKVIESKNKNLVGISGKVIDETKNTIKIESRDKKEKIIPKNGNVFEFTLPRNKRVTICGDEIRVRPEDRIKKKFKRWKYL
ncbi:MAG: ribonuclease P protein subunit [Candidatus Aenigmarchaeota archaeon]|nr:ribonuclease P protein subunit [Candidatus Aenigmarchaeota archaeon]